ncbi:MAG: translation initiation factor IF-5A [Candidatus Aenigmatarchaeota archaeon]
MATTKVAIKTLKNGKFCMIDGEPCKVQNLSTSVPGKHGGAKARLDAVGLFDNRHRSIVKPADTEIEVPIVEKKTAQVVAVNPPNVQLMDLETYETFDAIITDELKDKLQTGMEINYWDIEGRKMLIGIRAEKE